MPATNRGNAENLELGAVEVFFDNWKLGYTQGGVSYSKSVEQTDIEVDQENTSVLSIGSTETQTLTIPLAEWTNRNVQMAFPGAVIKDEGLATEYIERIPSTELAKGHLRLHPVEKDDDDYSEDIFYPLVQISGEVSFDITKTDLRLLQLTANIQPGKTPIAETDGADFYYKHFPVGARQPVTGVTVEPTSITLPVGDSIVLKPKVQPGNATVQGVTFTSDTPAVATVSENGTVTAVSTGSAAITITTNQGAFTATCSVTVS
jgi:uncharacterized protein YjdB